MNFKFKCAENDIDNMAAIEILSKLSVSTEICENSVDIFAFEESWHYIHNYRLPYFDISYLIIIDNSIDN